jgi:hypothetical protein
MADTRHDARFVEEHVHELGITSEVRVQLLDRHRASEAAGANHPAEMDGGHATRGDLVEHLTPADHALGFGRGVVRSLGDVAILHQFPSITETGLLDAKAASPERPAAPCEVSADSRRYFWAPGGKGFGSFSRYRKMVRGSTPRSRAVWVRLPLLRASTSST